jgi:hypothetical protein
LINFREVSPASHRHRAFKLGTKQPDHIMDALRAVYRETENSRAPDQYRVSTYANRLEDVGATPNAAIKQDWDAAIDAVTYGRKRFYGRGQGVEHSSSVVGDDNSRNASVNRLVCVVGIKHAFQDHG